MKEVGWDQFKSQDSKVSATLCWKLKKPEVTVVGIVKAIKLKYSMLYFTSRIQVYLPFCFKYLSSTTHVTGFVGWGDQDAGDSVNTSGGLPFDIFSFLTANANKI